ncbi:sigma-54-dependent Fis family transcriptional regulator [Thauera humireducens]|uniref:Sigma-54-dependent Fis family transcriptional regulator n=1 Tax=Thauera humireducens TaxID=1134435 RepID=A0A127KAU2_9RHOO|nr:sigma-54-dependent Fis family transcriptional regulator [Thauera humireducens]AMO39057.1 sigma-54-dependent Fis family transcriptional regulator [Thauera humireducens]
MGQTLTRAAQAATLESLRRQFFELGRVPEAGLPAPVMRSWQRCRKNGLDERDMRRVDNATRSEFSMARERNGRLLSHASGVMEHLYEQIRSSGSLVVLSDAQGMILHAIGDPGFVDSASRVALQPGADWSEEHRGTNAVGSALIERSPVEIFGGEHYLQRNSILTCSAAPIFDPCGQMLGVLDISGDHRAYQPHTLGLARVGAGLLERRLFEADHARHILIAFHDRPEGVGGLQEGLLAVSGEGEIMGADRLARALLGIDERPCTSLGGFANLFRTALGTMLDRAARSPEALLELELRNGAVVFARARASMAFHLSRSPLSSPARGTASRAATRARSAAVAAEGRITLEHLATGDAALQLALDRAGKVIGRNIPLLIQGESGVGKELLAQACHNSGPRASGPFVALNCAAIPENLIESELFGYVGGAFTGARREGAVGRIQQAHGGTLFLDEIGDMPLSMQARLLRVLQERRVVPIGASEAIPVDIALVCATHRVLSESVKAGSFREDLYYRVNGLTVYLPPLRERSDIRCIVERLIDEDLDGRAPGSVTVSEEVMHFFERYAWPGNIRQLQNVLRVALALLDDHEDVILSRHLPEEIFSSEAGATEGLPAPVRAPVAIAAHAARTRGRRLKDVQEDTILRVLAEYDGNVSAAARALGIARNTLYRKLGRDF